MKPKLHNPYRDGLAARFWACLRRNDKFRERLAHEHAKPKGKRARDWGKLINWARFENPCAAVALEVFLPLEGKCTLMATGEAPDDPAVHWHGSEECRESGPIPTLEELTKTEHAKVLGGIRDAWENELAPVPQLVGQWPWMDVGRWYDVIAVPNVIRDDAHRADILNYINKHLLRPAPRVAKRIAKNGDFLGSEAEWEAYLMFSYFSPLMAKVEPDPNKAAHYSRLVTSMARYEPRVYSSRQPETWATEDGIKSLGQSYEAKKQEAHIENRVAAIEQWIHRVFPTFRPFELPEQKVSCRIDASERA